jgi:2-C-methyl-D-erythritol 2,4-cyclodiphosphate synthase
MAYKGIDSKELLKHVLFLLEQKEYEIGNIDCTLCLQAPKIMPYVEEMRTVLSSILKIEMDNVSIKATTTEKLGYVGREEGITAYAVALIGKR